MIRFLLPICLLLVGGIGTAWPQEPWQLSEAQPPADVLAQMPQRAISLAYDEFPIRPRHLKVLVHAYAIPNGDRPKSEGRRPYSREDYHKLGVPMSRYSADFFLREQKTLRRVNRVTFDEDDGVTGIQLQWLEPKAKRVPIIAPS